MAKKQNGSRHHSRAAAPVGYKTPIEEARDELFQHIMKCGVIGALPEDQKEWFDNTMAYFQDRYPELKPLELTQLRQLGERFAQPLKQAV